MFSLHCVLTLSINEFNKRKARGHSEKAAADAIATVNLSGAFWSQTLLSSVGVCVYKTLLSSVFMLGEIFSFRKP